MERPCCVSGMLMIDVDAVLQVEEIRIILKEEGRKEERKKEIERERDDELLFSGI